MYSLFGSKDGLLVGALARDAFAFLHTEIAKLPETDDPASDLVGYRQFSSSVASYASTRRCTELPSSGSSRGSRRVPSSQQSGNSRGNSYVARVERLRPRGLLGDKPPAQAALEFNAMMEGLANAELRGAVLRLLPEGDEEEAWRRALATVVRGFATIPLRTRRAGDAGPSTSCDREGLSLRESL